MCLDDQSVGWPQKVGLVYDESSDRLLTVNNEGVFAYNATTLAFNGRVATFATPQYSLSPQRGFFVDTKRRQLLIAGSNAAGVQVFSLDDTTLSP